MPKLTETELLILKHMVLNNPTIAKKLNIGITTVKTHVHNILTKFEVPTRTCAILRAINEGIITTNDLVLYGGADA